MATGMNQYNNIAAATVGTTIRTGKGKLGSIVINQAIASGVITVYDGVSTGGTKIATITSPATLLQNWGTLTYNVCFQTGLFVVSDHNDNYTVCWEPL